MSRANGDNFFHMFEVIKTTHVTTYYNTLKKRIDLLVKESCKHHNAAGVPLTLEQYRKLHPW